MPIVNLVMGPPIFAPLLFGTSAYLGLLASYLQREEASPFDGSATEPQSENWREDIRTGSFQKHLCVVTAIGTLCSGSEAWYSHYKDNFKYRVQWSPILLTPLLAGAAMAGVVLRERRRIRAAGCSGGGDVERSDRDRVSHTRYSAASRREEEAAVQHALRAADFCADAVCGVRTAGHVGVCDAPGAAVMEERKPLTDPGTGKPLAREVAAGLLPGVHNAFTAAVLG